MRTENGKLFWVSYADLMTALFIIALALFVLSYKMFNIKQTDLSEAEEVLSLRTQSLMEAEEALALREAEIESQNRVHTELQQRLSQGERLASTLIKDLQVERDRLRGMEEKLKTERGRLVVMGDKLQVERGRLADTEDKLSQEQGRLVVLEDKLEKEQGRLSVMQGQLQQERGRLVVMEGKLQKEQGRLAVMEEEYKKLQEIMKSIENLDPRYFVYQSEYKRHVLRGLVQFPKGDSNIPSPYHPMLKRAGQALASLVNRLDPDDNIKYMLIIEGMASKDDYTRNYELSYERALSLVRLWESQGITFDNDRFEIMISGSGEGGVGRNTADEKRNQRFLIQIIPKIGELNAINFND